MTREEVLEYLHSFNEKHKKSGFTLVGLFGSYARNAADMFSDIDIIHDRS